MGNYMKLWLAKMVVDLMPLAAIFVAFFLIVSFLVVQDKIKRLFRRSTSGKGSEGGG